MDNIKNRMTEEDAKFYSDIFEPREVAVPLSNAWSHMSVLKDGRIREYGAYPRTASDKHVRAYIESCDGGLSWKEHILQIQDKSDNPPQCDYIGNSVYLDHLGKYVSIRLNSDGMFYTEADSQDEKPTKMVKISLGKHKYGHGVRNVVKLDKKDRLCFMVYVPGDEKLHCYYSVFVYSDDDGDSWNYVELKSVGFVEKGPRDLGERWQNFSCEPTFVELSDGTLMALVRTSHYFFYKYYSYDSGDTWTDPEPSIFHAFATQPVLHKLSDGRILMLWSNSMPLAETDHSEESIKDDSGIVAGIWEDVFTNRDMLNIAISEDDGKTWQGYREIALNRLRNSNYFRSQGGVIIGHDDKSLHQSQVLEMPYNKLLVCVGQHDVLRRIYLLDIDWLYEDSREDDLRNGLEAFSTQMYVKGVLGSYKGFSGHASYNRTHGVMMVPDNVIEEAMLVRRIPDELLVSDIQGAVWNYPLLREGKVTVKYKVKGEGIRLGISDFWINPSDPYAYERNIVSFDVNNKTEEYSLAEIKFNWDKETAELYINGVLTETKNFDKNSCHGFCYLHIQTLAEKEDREGTLVKFVKAEKL